MFKKLLFLSLLVTLNQPALAQDISGSWNWTSGEGGNMFTIELIQASENDYRGNHCSVYIEEEKVDCNDHKEEFTIVLIRKAENIFKGSIRSGLSYTIGHLQLQYLPDNNTLLFSLTNLPEGEFYIPSEAVMQR